MGLKKVRNAVHQSPHCTSVLQVFSDSDIPGCGPPPVSLAGCLPGPQLYRGIAHPLRSESGKQLIKQTGLSFQLVKLQLGNGTRITGGITEQIPVASPVSALPGLLFSHLFMVLPRQLVSEIYYHNKYITPAVVLPTETSVCLFFAAPVG